MKQYLLLLVFAGGLATASFAQEEKEEKEEKSIAPPAAAKAAFAKKFFGATKVKWEQENGDYEVGFLQAKKEMSALYDGMGKLKETEWEIKPGELPAAATAYIRQHYKGAKISEASKIETSGGAITYEAEVNGKDVIFDAKGIFIKVEKD